MNEENSSPSHSLAVSLILQILGKRIIHQGRAKGYNELLDELLSSSCINSNDAESLFLCIYLEAEGLKEEEKLVLFQEESEWELIPCNKILLETWTIQPSKLLPSTNPETHTLEAYLCHLPAFGLFQRLKRNISQSSSRLLSISFEISHEFIQNDDLNFFSNCQESGIVSGGISCVWCKNVGFRVKNFGTSCSSSIATPTSMLPIVTGMDENYFGREQNFPGAFSFFTPPLGIPWNNSNAANFHAFGASPMPSLFRNPSSLSNREKLVSLCPLVGEEEKEIEKFISCCQELLARASRTKEMMISQGGGGGKREKHSGKRSFSSIQPSLVRRSLEELMEKLSLCCNKQSQDV